MSEQMTTFLALELSSAPVLYGTRSIDGCGQLLPVLVRFMTWECCVSMCENFWETSTVFELAVNEICAGAQSVGSVSRQMEFRGGPVGLALQGIDKARHHHGDLMGPFKSSRRPKGLAIRTLAQAHLGSLAGIKGWAGSNNPPTHLCLSLLAHYPTQVTPMQGRLLSGE
jgi:hypothetical protein